MTSRRIRTCALACALVLLVPPYASASWAPQSDEWASFRQNLSHTGTISGTSAFTPGVGGAARVKWEKETIYPVLGSPAVADLDRDGTPEVVVASTDIHAQIATLDISFNHNISSHDGADGDQEWDQEEDNSFALAQGPSILDVDSDANAEVVYFAGNPILGTPATNKLVALSHAGAEQWRFSDTDALTGWSAAQSPVGIITFPQTANVDAEGLNETVFSMTQATFLLENAPAGPDCPDPDAQKIRIEGSMISYFVHALNGEGASANNSWKHKENSALMGSTPVIADLNGDGKNDVVWGSGSPSGPVLPGCEVEVFLDDSAVDNKVMAVSGSNPPNLLWTKSFQDPAGVDRPMTATPVLAGTTSGGDPILVFLVPVPDFEPVANDPDRNILWALNGKTGDTLWKTTVRPATIAPLAAADLDGDGRPEVIVQVADRLATFDNRDGSLQWEATYTRTLTSAGVAVADLDADGIKEIVTILEGSRDVAEPKAEVLVVSGADGAVEWSIPLLQDEMLGGPVIADVDGDDDLLEIVVAGGSPTVTENVDHKGRVYALEPNAPDLTVTNLEVIGSRIVNEAQTVRATVQNAGSRDAPSAAFRLTDDGATVEDRTISLAAGATTTIDFSWTPATFGNHTLRVVADPAGAIAELVENNNARQMAIRILARPNAAYTFSPASPDETQTVQFTDQSNDPDGSIVSRSWSCTDGFTSTATNPSHRFTEGGTYTCTLTVTDNDGLTDSETKTIVVSHVAPVANFSHALGAQPGQVQFTDTSTHPNSGDAPPAGWTYAWDFQNDGTVDSSARSPFHDYGVDSGTFDVRLRVTDNDGIEDDVVKVVRFARPLAAYAFSPASPNETQTVQFTDQSTDADGSIVSRSWSCTDGFTSSAANPSHRFAEGGAYSCTLTVTDNNGYTDAETKTIDVSHVSPVANYTHDVVNPGQVQFTDTSTHPNAGDAPPAGWTYAWDFENDGIVDSSARNPLHNFGVTSGVFSVRLRVTDNDGLSHEVVKQIDVGIVNQVPTANFKTQPIIPVAGADTSFIDQSSDPDGQIVRIDADWGDGTAPGSVSGANVAGSTIKHKYARGGDYTVTWKVTDNRGATDTEQRVVHVCQPPGATGPGIRVEVCVSV